MYSIIRFTGNPQLVDTLTEIGTTMNTIQDGIYSGPRRAGDGFTCELSGDADWGLHQRELVTFIEKFGELVRKAIQSGAAVTVDVAVEPEDRAAAGAAFVLRCEPELLAALASVGVGLEVSVY